MNTQTNGRRTSISFRGAIPAVAIVALAIGLGACQTPPQRAAAPVAPVMRHAQVPAGVDMWRPADRIAEQLARQASPSVNSATPNGEELEDAPADRIVERLNRMNAGMRVR